MNWNRQPAVRLVIGITAGIIAGRLFSFSLPLLLIIESAAIAAALVAAAIFRRRGKDIRMLCFVLILICIGMTKYAFDTTFLPRNHISKYISHPRQGVVLGTITEQPEFHNNRLSFIMQTSSILDDTGQTDVCGDIIVYLRYSQNDTLGNHRLNYGDVVALRGTLGLPARERNPGEFNYRNYLELNNIYAELTVPDTGDIYSIEKGEGSFLKSRLILPVREYVRSVVDKMIGGIEGAFLKGLIIGDRSEIPKEVQTSFINAGVIHILAVSGLNVAFVALIVVSLSSFIPGNRIVKTGIIILTLLFYMVVAGATPSIVRATLMVVVVLIGRMIQRRVDILNALAVSALIIYIYDTRQFFDVGFQLSYAAVISLVLLYPPLEKVIIPFLERNRFVGWISPVMKLFLVSFAAQVGTLPLIIQYFGRISIVSFCANLIVVPAANIALALGIIMVLFSVFSAWCASLVAAAAQILLYFMLNIITIAANFRWSVLDVHTTTGLHTLGYYLLLIIVFSLWKGSWMRKGFIVFLAISNVIVFYPVRGSVLSAGFPCMTVTFLDVGQGDAAVVEFPDGKTLLIDSGGRTYNSDAGHRFIVPFLKWKGITRIDAIVLTHFHSDHISGARSVIESFPVGKIYLPRSDIPSSFSTELHGMIQNRDVSLEYLTAGMRIDVSEDARLYVLNPSAKFLGMGDGSHRLNLNNTSVVLRLCYGRSSMLLMGDAEDAVEGQLCEYYGGFLRSSVIKVAHHGSDNASTGPFISIVQPVYAVVSVGKNNKFGHPSMDVLSRYEYNSVRVERTDDQGAVVFSMTPDSVWKNQWH